MAKKLLDIEYKEPKTLDLDRADFESEEAWNEFVSEPLGISNTITRIRVTVTSVVEFNWEE